MIRPAVLLLLAISIWTAPAAAQVLPSHFGLLVTGQNGTAGEFCWAFSCTPEQLAVVSGETLTLQVNAPYLGFYAIAASFSATRCLSIPGIAHQLVLDPVPVTLVLGVVSQPSPWLACWGGVEYVTLPLPAGLPTGLSFTTQALAEAPNFVTGTQLAFSTPVTLTVQ